MSVARLIEGGRAAVRVLCLALLALGIVLVARGAMVPAKAALAQMLLERAFERSAAANRPLRPWPWADTAPIARIAVARLGVRAVVLSGGSGQAMAFGPTELPRTGPRVTVMAAHRDTHFAFLRAVVPGDLVTVERVAGAVRTYRVVGMETVRWDRFAYPRDPARPLLALTTCYPFDATTHGPLRRVIWAELAAPIRG